MTRWQPTLLPLGWGWMLPAAPPRWPPTRQPVCASILWKKGGVTFVEDCYNASPDSMKAALSVLKALPNARKIALLGDMLELGDASEDGHRHTGEWAADAGVEVVIAYGPRSEAMAQAARERGVTTVHCQTAEEVLQYLRQFVRPGDAVLAKGQPRNGPGAAAAGFLQGIAAGVS